MRKRTTPFWLFALLALSLLSACGNQTRADTGSGYEGYVSANLDASYPDALPAATQLALGTLLLEGTDQAVTREQARALLPLWQALQGRRVQSSAESEALFRAIEQTMTYEQLQAIAAKRLTTQDLTAWLREHQPALPSVTPGGGGPYPELRATLRAGQGWSESAPWPQGTPSIRRTPGAGGRAMGSFYLLLDQVVKTLSERAGP